MSGRTRRNVAPSSSVYRRRVNPKKARWTLSSESNPTFNCAGEDYVVAFELPENARKHIATKVEELGVEAPEDLEFGYDRVGDAPKPPGYSYVENPADFLIDNGFLFELNRRIFHPLGLALELTFGDDGEGHTHDAMLVRIRDYRHDPEGVTFDDDTFAVGLRRFMGYMAKKGMKAIMSRRLCLGYKVQGDLDG